MTLNFGQAVSLERHVYLKSIVRCFLTDMHNVLCKGFYFAVLCY